MIGDSNDSQTTEVHQRMDGVRNDEIEVEKPHSLFNWSASQA